MGREVSTETFARICLELQARGAENINIVTGSHAAPALAAGIACARAQGLAIPALWNSSAYERAETLSLLEGAVDGYLPDLKTLDSAVSRRLFNAPDYPERAPQAIERMIQASPLRFKNNLLVSGVIIRHLALPGLLAASRAVLRCFADRWQGRALLSVMSQYTPAGNAPLKRPLNGREYERLVGWLREFAIDEGFCQDLAPDPGALPDFRRENPFPPALSTPVWHFAAPSSP
jgi:putative pyruvate formate lyase activating enzyme